MEKMKFAITAGSSAHQQNGLADEQLTFEIGIGIHFLHETIELISSIRVGSNRKPFQTGISMSTK